MSNTPTSPTENLGPASWSELGRLVSLLFFVYLGVNAALGRVLKYHSHNIGYQTEKTKWRILRELKSPVDIVILGDSTGNQGIVPAVLNARLHCTSLNLCTNAGGAPNDLWILDAYIKKFGAPRCILLARLFDIGERPPIAKKLVIQLPFNLWEWSHLKPKPPFTMADWIDLVVAKTFPAIPQDSTLSDVCRFPFEFDEKQPTFTSDGFRIVFHQDELSFQNLDPSGFSSKKIPAHLLPEGEKAILAHLSQLADQYGFRVYVVNQQFYEKLYDQHLADYLTVLYNDYREYLADKKRVRVLTKPILWKKYQMADPHHVRYPAAFQFTQFLADELQEDQTL